MIKDWLNGPHVTDAIRNKLEEWFKAGLKDWDISRDAPILVKIPGEDQKYFYVWLDAPIGYISTTQKWCDNQQKNLLIQFGDQVILKFIILLEKIFCIFIHYSGRPCCTWRSINCQHA